MIHNSKIKIIFKDAYLKVIDKPSGIISTQISSLICHRLDKETSGLLIVAKNREIKEKIQQLFKKRHIKKTYLALVSGLLPQRRGRLVGYIVRHKKKESKRRFVAAPAFAVREKHKRLAVSEYQVKKKFKKGIFKNQSQKNQNLFSLVKIRIFTGRSHQIRAQFASIHHPIVGDKIYGGKLMRQINKKLGLKRQFLHAYQLEFEHPIFEKELKLKSDLPKELKKVLKLLN